MSTERKPYGGGAGAAAANRVYEEVELPSSSAQWVPAEGYDTLVVNLKGYRKENIRIQLTSDRKIRVIGERPSLGSVGKESSKWQRFRNEFPIPLNCNANETTAKFEDGSLYVKIPKTIAPVETAPNNKKDQKLSTQPPTETLPPARSSAEAIPKPPPPPPQKPTTTSSRPAATSAAAQKITNNAQRTNEPSKEAIDKEKQQTNASSKANSGSQAQFANNLTKATTRADDSKAAEKEKEKVSAAVSTDQASNKANNKSNTTTTTTTNEEAQGTSKKTTTDGFPAEEKSPATTTQKSSDHEEYSSSSSSSMRRTQAGRGYYRQVIHGMVMELKEPRRLVNMAVAVVFVLLLGLYIKYAFNSIQEFKHQEL